MTEPVPQQVNVVTSARRRRVALSVRDGVLTLHLPQGFPDSMIGDILERNRELIARLRQQEQSMPEQHRPEFRLGAMLPMLGEMYPVELAGKGYPEFRADRFLVTAEDPAKVKRQILLIYGNHAAAVISRKVFAMSRKHNITYSNLNINSAATRWGSCSGNGSLNFSWKLILCPEPMVDYVVAHELAHRREMNHSAAFWREVEMLCPNYRTWRKALKEQAMRYRAWNTL